MCISGIICSRPYLWYIGVSLRDIGDSYCYDNEYTGSDRRYFVYLDGSKCKSVPDSVIPFALKMIRLYRESKASIDNTVISFSRNSFEFFSNTNSRL